MIESHLKLLFYVVAYFHAYHNFTEQEVKNKRNRTSQYYSLDPKGNTVQQYCT